MALALLCYSCFRGQGTGPSAQILRLLFHKLPWSEKGVGIVLVTVVGYSLAASGSRA